MRRKAISPVVAAVMLIAITMIISGVVALWVSSYTRRTTTGMEENVTALKKCIAADFSIYYYFYNQTSKTLTIILENKADVDLKIIEVDVILANGTISKHKQTLTLPKEGGWESIQITGLDSCKKFKVISECVNVYKEATC